MRCCTKPDRRRYILPPVLLKREHGREARAGRRGARTRVLGCGGRFGGLVLEVKLVFAVAEREFVGATRRAWLLRTRGVSWAALTSGDSPLPQGR
mgnify:FL=1